MKISPFSIARGALTAALDRVSGVKIALIGDICLDAYWHADMRLSELSRETPHFPLPITREVYSPGAGGNAAKNVAALAPRKIYALGCVGRDWRGETLKSELIARGVDISGVITDENIITNAYIKPMRHGISGVVYEDARLDFVNTIRISESHEEKLICDLRKRAAEIDCLCVADQLARGVITQNIRAEINRLAREGLFVFVDSRDSISSYKNCALKPNELELSRATGATGVMAARALAVENSARVIATLGADGCVYADGERIIEMSAVEIAGEIDICGAGDAFLAACACALAGGADIETAMAAGALASAVAIRKIGETGSATRDEIMVIYEQGACGGD